MRKKILLTLLTAATLAVCSAAAAAPGSKLKGDTQRYRVEDSAGTNWLEITPTDLIKNGASLISSFSDAFPNGGNAGGADRSMGNTDAYSLSLLTDGVARLVLSAGGTVSMSGEVNVGSALRVYSTGWFQGTVTAQSMVLSSASTIAGNTIWHAGNDGSGSGLDADTLDGNSSAAFSLSGHDHTGVYYATGSKVADSELLDGYNSAQAATASTIPVRSGDGSLYVYFLSTTAPQTATAATNYFVETGSDNWMRKKSLANVQAEIVTKAAVEASLTGAITSHTHAYLPLAGGTLTGTLTGTTINATTLQQGGTGVSSLFLGISAKAADSNLLDGVDSLSFVRSDAADTISGVLTFDAIPAFNGGLSGTSAPFSVDSSTLVTNLNADLLDGNQASAFSLTSHTHDYSATYLGISAKAADSNLLDGIDSTGFSLSGHTHSYLPLSGGTLTGATTIQYSTGALVISDNASATTGVGGRLVLHGSYTGTTVTDGGYINLKKQNATAGNYSFDMAIATRSSGTATTEKVLINYAGNTTFGGSSAGHVTDLAGTTYRTWSDGVAGATRFYSNVAAGTAPYTCLSTTLNTNLNADLLDGYNASATQAANTVVVRNASGYIMANYINSNIGQDNIAASSYIYETGSDGYLRKKSLANVKTEIVTKAAVEASLTGPITTHTHDTGTMSIDRGKCYAVAQAFNDYFGGGNMFSMTFDDVDHPGYYFKTTDSGGSVFDMLSFSAYGMTLSKVGTITRGAKGGCAYLNLGGGNHGYNVTSTSTNYASLQHTNDQTLFLVVSPPSGASGPAYSVWDWDGSRRAVDIAFNSTNKLVITLWDEATDGYKYWTSTETFTAGAWYYISIRFFSITTSGSASVTGYYSSQFSSSLTASSITLTPTTSGTFNNVSTSVGTWPASFGRYYSGNTTSFAGNLGFVGIILGTISNYSIKHLWSYNSFIRAYYDLP